jgi:hypothetical protein
MRRVVDANVVVEATCLTREMSNRLSVEELIGME